MKKLLFFYFYPLFLKGRQWKLSIDGGEEGGRMPAKNGEKIF